MMVGCRDRLTFFTVMALLVFFVFAMFAVGEAIIDFAKMAATSHSSLRFIPLVMSLRRMFLVPIIYQK